MCAVSEQRRDVRTQDGSHNIAIYPISLSGESKAHPGGVGKLRAPRMCRMASYSWLGLHRPKWKHPPLDRVALSHCKTVILFTQPILSSDLKHKKKHPWEHGPPSGISPAARWRLGKGSSRWDKRMMSGLSIHNNPAQEAAVLIDSG